MTDRRCSAAGVWRRCAMSPSMVAKSPERPTHPAAAEGTAAHELAALVLTGQINHADDMVGRTSTNGVEFDGDMAGFVTGYVDFVRQKVPSGLVVEQRVEYPTPGTTDGAGLAWDPNTKTLRVIDLKYGHKAVEAVNNFQLLNYAFGMCHLWDIWPDRIEMWIYQPRARHRDGIVRGWVLDDPGTIKRQYDDNIAGAMACDTPNPKGWAGKHCQNCDAVGTCTLVADWLRVGAQKTLSAAYRPLEAGELSDELEFYDGLTSVLDARKKAHEEQAEHLITSGAVVPGWTISQKVGNRVIKPGVDLAQLEMVYGLPMHEQKPKTPAAIERELKAAGMSPKTIADLFERPKTGFALSRTQNPEEVFK